MMRNVGGYVQLSSLNLLWMLQESPGHEYEKCMHCQQPELVIDAEIQT